MLAQHLVVAEHLVQQRHLLAAAIVEPHLLREQASLQVHELDRATGLQVVRMTDVQTDQSDFNLRYEPGHPAANGEGYVRYPNVQTLVEMMDMREAQRSYEANLSMVEGSRRMMERTLDLLRR